MLAKQLMSRGSYDSHAPLPAPNGWEARGLDINEGHQVELQASSAIPCIVSFSPGQERRVYFSVSGAPLSRAAEYLSSGLASAAGQQQQQLHPNRGIQIELKNDARLAAGLLHSSAAVVLADPAPTRLNTGIVASLAPLMGSDPMQDKNVQKWLHVHVRPSVRGLLRVLQSATLSNHHKITLPAQQQSEKQGQGGGGFGAKKVGILSAMRQLADGHWVLAFPDAPRSHLACQTVKQHAEKLRSVYAELLLSFVVNGT